MAFFNETENEEREYLKKVQQLLVADAARLDEKFNLSYDEVLENKKFFTENQSHIDSMEKILLNYQVGEDIDKGEAAAALRDKRLRQVQTPYFARIDFNDDSGYDEALYIGVNEFIDPETEDIYIYDWRSPVASMYYNFDNGKAHYSSPVREIYGEITRRRQYRIINGEFKGFFESSMTVNDDILQKELSGNSGEKMRNIVATIQREQNEIIRYDYSPVLIVQGVAGSGKTSIALHRVAYLLYKRKGKLKAENILIISPNTVFGDYISNVLPELGEENIKDICMDGFANLLLHGRYNFQTFFEQVEYLLENNDDAAAERIRIKSSAEFSDKLKKFIDISIKEHFSADELFIEGFELDANKVREIYEASTGSNIEEILTNTAEKIIDIYNGKSRKKGEDPMPEHMQWEVHSQIKKMFRYPDAMELYKAFYKHLGREDLFCMTQDGKLEYSDVFPLIYIMLYRSGIGTEFKKVQHLLIDEMQDYTPIQYAVISKIFDCEMTILGDGYQSVNPDSSSVIEEIQPLFVRSHCTELNNSYRSTYEILEFSKRVINNEKLIPMDRHGDAPTVTACADGEEQLKKINSLIDEYKKCGYTSIGVICKSMKQAKHIYEKLAEIRPEAELIDFESSEFANGIAVTSAHTSKGLEFDCVILPDASSKNYATRTDRGLLYIGCTRAMHRLDLTYIGEISELIEKQ